MLPTEDGGYIMAIYGDFVDVISKANSEALLPHPIDCAIDLEPGYNCHMGELHVSRVESNAVSS